MARLIALSHRLEQDWQLELPRAALVCACALALIAAGKSLPF